MVLSLVAPYVAQKHTQIGLHNFRPRRRFRLRTGALDNVKTSYRLRKGKLSAVHASMTGFTNLFVFGVANDLPLILPEFREIDTSRGLASPPRVLQEQ